MRLFIVWNDYMFYFIAPSGHGLKPLDVEYMQRLHDKVNIIPLIAKADTMTPDECREFKKTVSLLAKPLFPDYLATLFCKRSFVQLGQISSVINGFLCNEDTNAFYMTL